MEIEVLICTCNEGLAKAVSVPLSARPGVSYLISHQRFDTGTDSDYSDALASIADRLDIRLEISNSKGLSNNRNTALSLAHGEILLFADDDVVLLESFNSTLLEAFNVALDAGILSFKIQKPDGAPYKSYRSGKFKHNRISAMRVSSIELAIRRSTLKEYDVSFDHRFGLGATYPACEESIFLADAVRSGVPCYFYPQFIVQHPANSSGSAWNSVDSVKVRGALMKRVFGIAGLPLLFAFAVRQRKRYGKNFSFLEFLSISCKSYFRFDR